MLKWCRGAESDRPRLPFQGSALPLSYLGTIIKTKKSIPLPAEGGSAALFGGSYLGINVCNLLVEKKILAELF